MEKKYGPLATKARNALEKEFKKGKRSKDANSSANFLMEDGTSVKAVESVCYASLSGNTVARKAVAIIASVQTLIVDEKIARRYFEWLLHYSPYQEVFVTKRGKTAIDHGIFVADTDKPSNLLFGGLTAARMVSECDRIPNMWNDLVDSGVHPDLAFVFSHYLHKNKDKLVVSGLGNGHTAIYGVPTTNAYYAGFTDVVPINFVKNIRIDKLSYRKTGSFSGINATWTKENDLAIKLKLIEAIPKVLEEACKEKSKSANPFKKDAEVKAPDYHVGLEAVSALFKDKLKGII